MADLGRTVPVREALDLIGELQHERSHFAAAAAGWSRPASTTDLHLQLLTTAAGAKLPWPWQGTGQAEAPATPEERAEAEALLQKYSAIRDN